MPATAMRTRSLAPKHAARGLRAGDRERGGEAARGGTLEKISGDCGRDMVRSP